MTIAQSAAKLRAREISSVELTMESLRKIRAAQPILNAFVTVTEELALEQARRADEELARGIDRGPLHGIPYALKDMFETKGIRTTCGSSLFAEHIPTRDAAVYEKLTEAGAVLMGKTNLHELAYGITSNNPHFGAVRNPRDTGKVPGGSSGGSGAAVSAGLVSFAMGSDTGGSIRIPAAFCGCVGLKPTSGRVSRYGTLPLDFSLDHMGPLTGSVEDSALVLNAIAGFDHRDDTSSRHPVTDYALNNRGSLHGVRIGIAINFFNERMETRIRAAFEQTVAHAASNGAEIVSLELPDPAAITTIGRVILLSEASALLEKYADNRAAFGSDVIALIDQGRMIAATDYINAQRLRRLYQQRWASVWQKIDALLVPATPNEAPAIGQTTVSLAGVEEEVRLTSTRFVRCFNVLGNPALSIPYLGEFAQLLSGMQLVGAPFDEGRLLTIGTRLSAEL